MNPWCLAHSLPTTLCRPTRYESKQPIPAKVLPADAGRPRLDCAHSPLAWMLVLTQMGAGMFLFGALAAVPSSVKSAIALVASGLTILGIALSVLHLGQPLKAWRAFLGWRRSWLSREIIAFGGFAKLSVVPTVTWWITGSIAWLNTAMALAALGGIVAVLCSIMVYVDTRRPFWSSGRVSLQFAGTGIVLGSGFVALTSPPLATLSAIVVAGLLCADVIGQRQALVNSAAPAHASARVMVELLGKQTTTRRALLAAAGILFSIGAYFASVPALLPAVMCAFAACVIERHQFFTACSGPRMTGN